MGDGRPRNWLRYCGRPDERQASRGYRIGVGAGIVVKIVKRDSAAKDLCVCVCVCGILLGKTKSKLARLLGRSIFFSSFFSLCMCSLCNKRRGDGADIPRRTGARKVYIVWAVACFAQYCLGVCAEQTPRLCANLFIPECLAPQNCCMLWSGGAKAKSS